MNGIFFGLLDFWTFALCMLAGVWLFYVLMRWVILNEGPLFKIIAHDLKHLSKLRLR